MCNFFTKEMPVFEVFPATGKADQSPKWLPWKSRLAKPLSGARQLVAMKGKGYAMVYAPFGDSIAVKLGSLGFKEKKCWWYNPRDGKAELIKTTASNGNETFNPPGDAVRKNDWLLVIDDVAKGWGAPGTVATP